MEWIIGYLNEINKMPPRYRITNLLLILIGITAILGRLHA